MANPSTADLVQIAGINDAVIALKDGSLRAVVEISAINFELRSSDEQQAILQQFEAFLNSVDFPLQMVVHSRRFDISKYVAGVNASAEALANELLKVQAQEYARFVGELSELANIMAKRFYVVLPFTVVAVKQEGEKKKGGLFGGLFSSKPATVLPTDPAAMAAYQQQLTQRADLIIGGLSGLSLKGRLLREEELFKLFTELYNPVVPPPQQQKTA